MILNGKFVFIVQDNPQNHLLFQMALNPLGAWTEFESSGKTALERLKKRGRVHLIILDLDLSGSLGGYALYDQIRRLPDMLTMPIVAAAESDPYTTLHRTRRRGFDGLIFKPLEANGLRNQITRVMNGEKVWAIAH